MVAKLVAKPLKMQCLRVFIAEYDQGEYGKCCIFTLKNVSTVIQSIHLLTKLPITPNLTSKSALT